MRTYFRFVLAHPGWVIFACIFLTVLSGVSLTQMTIASSLVDLILGDDPDYELYVERAETFGNDEILIVAFPEPELASEASLERLRRVRSHRAGLYHRRDGAAKNPCCHPRRSIKSLPGFCDGASLRLPCEGVDRNF